MPMFLLKSYLSLLIVLSALLGLYTMLELLGRPERRFSAQRLRAAHRLNGIFYLALFLFISFFCLRYVATAQAELSARGTAHSALALLALFLLLLKIAIARRYRQFYDMLKVLGLTLAAVSMLMAGISGGYYLTVARLGTDLSFGSTPQAVGRVDEQLSEAQPGQPGDPVRGRELYSTKCFGCHDPLSNQVVVGPGHKGILKNKVLPASGRPATEQNIRRQLMDPLSSMPSFSYLKAQEVADIVAYLKTL